MQRMTNGDRPPTARFRWSTIGLALALVTTGCAAADPGSIPPGTPEPDRYLFETATELFEENQWIRARRLFGRIVDTYPQSPYRFDAKLRVGDTFLEQGGTANLIQAVNEFAEFLRFYPTNPRADYAQYMIGVCHHRQMLSPDRDQTETRAAVDAFQLFLDSYPTSELTDEGRARHREARDQLSESELRVGAFYYRLRWYPGAIQRLRALFEEDPQFSGRDGVYFYLAESLLSVDQSAEALPYFERLVQEFEESEYLIDARRRIDELKGQGT